MSKKICLETLKILLTPKEMKNLTGGSLWNCSSGGCGGPCSTDDGQEGECELTPEHFIGNSYTLVCRCLYWMK